MKEFIISEAKVETAVLVGLITQMQENWKRSDNIYGQKRKKNVKWEWSSLTMNFPRNKYVTLKPN